jgi:hypothetical protein
MQAQPSPLMPVAFPNNKHQKTHKKPQTHNIIETSTRSENSPQTPANIFRLHFYRMLTHKAKPTVKNLASVPHTKMRDPGSSSTAKSFSSAHVALAQIEPVSPEVFSHALFLQLRRKEQAGGQDQHS